jgi:hypothetical protein
MSQGELTESGFSWMANEAEGYQFRILLTFAIDVLAISALLECLILL